VDGITRAKCVDFEEFSAYGKTPETIRAHIAAAKASRSRLLTRASPIVDAQCTDRLGRVDWQ